MPPIIEVRGVSKKYRLGQIGMTSLREDVERLGRWFGSLGRSAPASPDAAPDARDFWALRDVSFDVQPGEVLGIIGRNGAGKSTLLKILSRITDPTSGEVRMRGRVGSLLEVGTGFHPELSGRDNIFLNGSILGMTNTEIARKFDEIVAFAEVAKFIDTPVKRYSSGMYVRLAFAIAAHLEPEILIVDEVLAVGDVDFQKKCLSKMEGISAQQHRTILFVSHNVTAIRRLCSRCIVMNAGRASEVLPVDQAVEIYLQGQTRSANLVPLSAQPRHPNQGHRCRLLSIGLPDSGQLRYGEPGSVDVRFVVNEPIRGLMAGLGFDTPDGQRVMTLDSDAMGEAFDLAPGEHCIRVGLNDWPLHPANYLVSVALLSGHNCLDSVPRAALWEVQTSPIDNVSDRGYGAVRPKPVVHLLA